MFKEVCKKENKKEGEEGRRGEKDGEPPFWII